MEVIIYTDIDAAQKDSLIKKTSRVSDLTPLIVCDFNSLLHLLKSKISGKVIIVFLISSMEELDRLVHYKSDIINTQYIIILPNQEEALTSKALSLYPRYLAHKNHGFEDVCAVLNKMIQNNIRKENLILNACKTLNE